ncbi:MAG: hypothetical protein ABIT38_21535 [Gemmatimonadaceae bacterium]
MRTSLRSLAGVNMWFTGVCLGTGAGLAVKGMVAAIAITPANHNYGSVGVGMSVPVRFTFALDTTNAPTATIDVTLSGPGVGDFVVSKGGGRSAASALCVMTGTKI